MNTPCPVVIAQCLFHYQKKCVNLYKVISIIIALHNNQDVVFCKVHSLLENLGGLSLTSLRVMLMVVVPASPPSWPPMSLAWINTWYCSFTSLSILGKAVFITPGVQQDWWEIQIIKKRYSGEGRADSERQRWRDRETKVKRVVNIKFSEKKRLMPDAQFTSKSTIYFHLSSWLPCKKLHMCSDQGWNRGHLTNWKHLTFNRELWWSHIMIHLRIRDPEIRERLYCRLIARSVGGWQAKKRQPA